jgi:HK97 family phage portal protein
MATTRKTAVKKAIPRRSTRTQIEIRGLSDSMPWGVYIPPDQVTAEVAVRVTAILACVRFIAQSCASMTPRVMRVGPGGRKMAATDLPCYQVLTRRPNSWQSWYEHAETTIYHTALHGNAYDLVVPGKYGFCSELRPLHPSRMQVRRLSDFQLEYSYLYPEGVWKTYSQSQIIHHRWISDNSFMGMIPSDLCGTSVALARKLDVAASSFWDNSARPDVVLQTQEAIPDAAVQELRRQWREMYGGARNRGSAAVLPKKVEAKTLDSNSQEASQYMELRSSLTSEVARAYGVPETLIGGQGKGWNTAEQEFLIAQVHCLLPWQCRYEGAINRSILNEDSGPQYAGTFFKLDSRALLRADVAGRTSLYQALFNMGAISPNELRDLEDLPLLDEPNADETYLQLGFAPLRVSDQANGRGADGQPAMTMPADDEFSLSAEGSSVDPSEADEVSDGMSDVADSSIDEPASKAPAKKEPSDG